MPKYKVTATKDVGYSAIIEADSQEEAWEIAKWGEEIGRKPIMVTIGQ